MSKTSWNSDEDDALRQCTWMARLVYLQGIRRAMDYRTGIAGRATVISYQRLTEILDCTTHTTAPDPVPTKRMLQRSFESLERAGLIRWIKPEGVQRGIVFECLLADRDESVQKQAVPKRYPSGTQEEVPIRVNNYADSSDVAVPALNKLLEQEAVPPPESGVRGMSDTSEQREREVARARGSRLSLTELPPDWHAYLIGKRRDLDPVETWERFRDYWIAQPGQKGVKADWAATWRTWVGREKTRINGNGHHHESATERRDRINREFIEAGIRAAESEMG